MFTIATAPCRHEQAELSLKLVPAHVRHPLHTHRDSWDLISRHEYRHLVGEPLMANAVCQLRRIWGNLHAHRQEDNSFGTVSVRFAINVYVQLVHYQRRKCYCARKLPFLIGTVTVMG